MTLVSDAEGPAMPVCPRLLGGLFHLGHRVKVAQGSAGTGLHISRCPLSRASSSASPLGLGGMTKQPL